MGQEKLYSAVPVAQSVGRAELPQPGLRQPGDPSQGHVHTLGSPLQPPQGVPSGRSQPCGCVRASPAALCSSFKSLCTY